jgi:hypothetical protein
MDFSAIVQQHYSNNASSSFRFKIKESMAEICSAMLSFTTAETGPT